MSLAIKMFGKTLEQRREELAKRIYGKPYSSCCWLQEKAINDRIRMEDMQDSTVGG